MATLKQRMHKKNSSGTYDTVHLETSSSLVLRPSGRTVEQDLADYLPKTQASDTPPSTLKPSLVVGLSKMWYNKTEVATKEELENVKGMIEMSARLVKTQIAWGATETISISEPFDYCKVISIPGIDLESLSIVATCKLTKDCQCAIPVMTDNRDGVKVERTIFTMDASGVIRHNLISGTDFAGVTFEFYKYQ